MSYLFHLFVLWSFFASLALSLDLAVGQLGILSLCHSAFYAVGAYLTAVSSIELGLPCPIACLAGAAGAALLSVPVAWTSRRLRHDALVLATLAILLIVLELLRNLRSITGGQDGLAGIPPIQIGQYAIRSNACWAVIGLIALGTVVFVVKRITNSPLGRSLRAYRDDPALSLAIGVWPSRIIGTALAVSAGLAGLIGGLYAAYASYISPSVFGLDLSVLILAMVVIGGAGTLGGPILGALLLVAIPEGLRVSGFESAKVGAFQQTLFGVAMLVFAVWRPSGLLKGYRFR